MSVGNMAYAQECSGDPPHASDEVLAPPGAPTPSGRGVSSAYWQAALVPPTILRVGRSRVQRSLRPGCQHRVWNGHPDGGVLGLGTSPVRTMRLRRRPGSGSGTADSRATV